MKRYEVASKDGGPGDGLVWAVEAGPGGGWLLSQYNDSSNARASPFVLLLFFLVAFGAAYFTPLDVVGEDVQGITALESKILWALALWTAVGIGLSLRSLLRRNREGDVSLELDNPLLCPGTSTSFRLSTTRQASLPSPKIVLCCGHSAISRQETWTEIFALTVYAEGELVSAERRNQWTGTLSIPSEAKQLRPSQPDLNDESWSALLQRLGPTCFVGSEGTRARQARIWQLHVYPQSVQGGHNCETFKLHVFFTEDKIVELPGRQCAKGGARSMKAQRRR